MSLSELIHSRLQHGEPLTFTEFMHIALYNPQWGYYSGGLQKFGAQGDFVTAPELTPLFGYTLANQCQQILVEIANPVILEFGAGSGRLCIDVLTRLEQLDCLPVTYQILEVSNNLRQRQKELIQAKIPHLAERIQWLDNWPQTAFAGIVLANEVLDAMPVHRFLQTDQGIFESCIEEKNNQLHEVFNPCTDQRLLDYLKTALPTTLYPYYSEANLFIDGWLEQCGQMLTQGAVILLDYGFPRHEYYHSDRNQGTLMCHYRHQAHPSPLVHIGEQDITAHVDFTHVAEAAQAAGFHVAGYTNQAAFLLANGLLSLLTEITDNVSLINAQQAVKQLVQPSEMGELFKVIALTKNLEVDLTGFQLHDKRASL